MTCVTNVSQSRAFKSLQNSYKLETLLNLVEENRKTFSSLGTLPKSSSKASKKIKKPSNTKNIHLNYSSRSQSSTMINFKASRNFKDFGPSKLHQIQALKPRRTPTKIFKDQEHSKNPQKTRNL